MALLIEEQRHPIDGILADLATIVRRARGRYLSPAAYTIITTRMRDEMAAADADPDGIIGARLTMLEVTDRAGHLTLERFEEVTSSIRARLLERKSSPLPVVPNFAVLPSGVHGRQIGRFMVVEGGASNPTEHTLKGA